MGDQTGGLDGGSNKVVVLQQIGYFVTKKI